MARDPLSIYRRRLLQLGAALVLTGPLGFRRVVAEEGAMALRTIPSTGEQIPVLGMGSWLTFDVAASSERDVRVQVLETFFRLGGRLIDSSPMYGLSEETIGYCLNRLRPPHLFSATKVWTPGRLLGERQMQASLRLWGGERFDLMQVHNLLDWRVHLKTLRDMKEQGRLRYIGMTTSHGRSHDELEHILRTEPIDFVQFTYNIQDREAEQRLLPLAQDLGVATIINRPFQRRGLFRTVAGRPLPPMARQLGCRSWAQFFLLFVISNPLVTCAIPATRRVDHMQENMRTARLEPVDGATRRAMITAFDRG